MPPIMELKELSKIHPNSRERVKLFSDITAVVEEATTIAVLGLSGQGKSTLLRIMGRLEVPDGGELWLNGKESHSWLAKQWRIQASYVAQQPVMLPGTVEDNLCTVSRLHARPFDRPLASELMAAIGLAHINWDKPAEELSGGEKQRVALVRSLFLHPQVLLLDEVTSSLDTHNCRAVENLLFDWQKEEGTAFVWVTHDLRQAQRVSQAVWFMAEGTLLEQQPTQFFFNRPATTAAREFARTVGKGSE